VRDFSNAKHDRHRARADVVKKHLLIQQIALENKLPFVRLVESGGANLLYQAEMRPSTRGQGEDHTVLHN
jgi:acetyl-CoA carboxylase carboxyltransferase component